MARHDNDTLIDMNERVEEEELLDGRTTPEITDGSTRRKVRGATRGLSVQKKKPSDKKLDIVIHPERNRIVGENAKYFKTEGSVILKQHAPIEHARWKDIPADIKRKMWVAMKQKFNLDEDARVRKVVFGQLNIQYRNHRHKLHKYYQDNKSDGQILAKPPTGINRENWKILVDHFETDSFKRISSKNKDNRGKLTMAHTCGTKSIAQYCYDERDSETGEEPTRTASWRLSRYNPKTKGWIDESSREIYEELVRLQTEPNEDGEGPMSENEAFVKLLGEEKSTRLRGCGDGLKPPSKRGERINLELQKENGGLRKQNEDLSSRFESLEAQVKSNEANMQIQLATFLKQFPAINQSTANS